ncbi:unnamed protein product [Ranitomeya imitator]|uniref:Cocaine- and amphetamine-regulated transcript protein n=1 Tax=Ranitomeya imitator TaxID=111125 RepID=A0ABN9L1N6_9NEOB|nr:unnamed protein product [Ranitomeya imitator]
MVPLIKVMNMDSTPIGVEPHIHSCNERYYVTAELRKKLPTPGDHLSGRSCQGPRREQAVALGELLEYNHDRIMAVEKRAVQCDMGERCAMKHGPRIGKLCDCLRGASCNSFMLRCY